METLLENMQKIGAYCSAFLRRHVFTHENLWAIIVSIMLLLIVLLMTANAAPRFVYGGF